MVVEPIARALISVGLSANAVTVAGTVISILLAVVLIPTGHLFAAAVLSGVFVAFDLLDGTMARMSGGGTKFGATLDASCDRLSDGALFAAITWWLVYGANDGAGAARATVAASFGVLIFSQVISYVKARGEASGFKMVGGLVERPERLIIGLVGTGLAGLSVPYALDVAVWLLFVGSAFTVVQRLQMAARQPVARERIAAPSGAKPAPAPGRVSKRRGGV